MVICKLEGAESKFSLNFQTKFGFNTKGGKSFKDVTKHVFSGHPYEKQCKALFYKRNAKVMAIYDYDKSLSFFWKISRFFGRGVRFSVPERCVCVVKQKNKVVGENNVAKKRVKKRIPKKQMKQKPLIPAVRTRVKTTERK
ncbi:MAG: hypothetical protein ABIE74_09485 [Pseudomonadota bacterium]